MWNTYSRSSALTKFMGALLWGLLGGLMVSQVHAGPPWIAAKVVKVDPEKARVVLDHQRIERVNMDAMVMPFKVLPGVKLDGLKPGDKVRFMVALQNDHLVIDALEKTP